jgi:hypothetical protein
MYLSFKKSGNILKPFFHRVNIKVYYSNSSGWVYSFTQGVVTKTVSDFNELKARKKLIDYLKAEEMI